MSETETPPAAFVAIMKGEDPKKLTPLTLITMEQNDGTLEVLRNVLNKSGYMKGSDLFLSRSSFPIHKQDESQYKWEKALWPIPDNRKPKAGEEPKPDEDDDPEPTEEPDGNGSTELDPIANTSHPYIAILSETEKKRDDFKDPELPEEHKFTPLPDPKIPTLPDAPKLATVDPGTAAASKAAVNAATLDNKQLTQIFDINGIFCGSSVVDHPSSRVCARIFKTPASLLPLIQVSDSASIETHVTSSAHHSNCAKYGFAEAEVHASTPWVKASVSYSQSNRSSTTTDDSKSYVTAIYRYSRAIVRLPTRSLEPTEEFKDDLKNALIGETKVIKQKLEEFFTTYGHVIATEVHLGGHLHMTDVHDKKDGADTSSKEKSVRASLTTVVHVGGSGQWASKEDHDTSHAQSAADLGIEAIGGNTLLASNLALWPLSVMPPKNWRVTKLAKLR
ncbi:hypothetical protein FRC11_008040, partial [Ceratobasidium sp. 423]